MEKKDDKLASRRDFFKKLKADKDEANTSGGFNFENPESIHLKDDEYRIVRLLGLDFQSKDRTSTDPHLFKTSFIKGDNGKKIKMIYNPDFNHPFNEMVRMVCKGKWEEGDDGKKKKVYEHTGSNSLKIFNSNNFDDSQYPQSWDSPTQYITINCIDRMDNWCKENKHSKLLVHDMSENDGKVYYEIGMRKQTYDLIWEQLCTKYELHFNDFDIAIRKVPKDKAKKTGIYYEIVRADRATDDLAEAGEKEGKDYNSAVVSDYDLTEEEKNYELYDFENNPHFLPTSTKRLFNHIKSIIKKVDAEFDTNFIEKFNEYIETEEAERKEFWAKYKKDHSSQEEENEENTSSSEAQKEEATEEKTASSKKLSRSVKKEFDLSSIDTSMYEGWDKLTDEEKSLIIGVDDNTGLLIFKPECQLSPCVNEEAGCDCPLPIEFHACYACGAEFDDDEE